MKESREVGTEGSIALGESQRVPKVAVEHQQHLTHGLFRSP